MLFAITLFRTRLYFAVNDPDPECPRKWELIDGRCYSSSQGKYDYLHSYLFCTLNGADLAVIDSSPKQEALEKAWVHYDVISCNHLPLYQVTSNEGGAWLTGPEPRSVYARTSFGIDAAAEVTISTCNYGNLEHWDQSFPTHIWLFSAKCGMLAGFIKTMQAEERQNYKKYINIL